MGTFTIPSNEPVGKVLAISSWWKGIPNADIIGVLPGARLIVQTTDDDGEELSGWTKNIDIDSYSYGAVVSLVNGTGSTRTIVDVALLGAPVTISQGDTGLVLDSFADWESILNDGEKIGEFGSDYIVDMTQLKSCADYVWKYARGKKHKYILTLPGTRYDFRPASRHMLRIGGAGETEYIDSVVEVLSVQTDRSWTGLGYTRIVFREVMENWKFDSNAIARSMAQGYLPATRYAPSTMIVATSQYIGPAHRYLTGTDDQDTINDAIDKMSSISGGGVVQIVGYKIFTTAAVELKKGVTLDLGGASIVKNCNDYGVKCEGGSGSEITFAGLRNGTITRDSSDTNTKQLVLLYYADNFRLDNISAVDAHNTSISCYYSDNVLLTNIFVDGFGASYGFHVVSSTGEINNIIIDGRSVSISTTAYGFYISGKCKGSNISVKNVTGASTIYGFSLSGDGSLFSSVNVENVICTNGTYSAVGVDINASKTVVTGISVDDITNTGTASKSYGIRIDSGEDDNVLSGIYSTNCSGTGVLVYDSACDNNVIVGRSTGNGTNLTDNGTNTNTNAFDDT